MKTYHPTSTWVTPPENQGQIVTISYTLDADAEVILQRSVDASDQSQAYRAYAYPENENDGDWQPWNGTPNLGRDLGPCKIEE